MAPPARAAFARAVADADVRVVASGHRHRHHRDGRAVWAPVADAVGPDVDLPRRSPSRLPRAPPRARRRHDAGRRAARGSASQHDREHDGVQDGVGQHRRRDAAQQVGGAAEGPRPRRTGSSPARCCRRREPDRRGRAPNMRPCTMTAHDPVHAAHQPRQDQAAEDQLLDDRGGDDGGDEDRDDVGPVEASSPMPSVLLVSGMRRAVTSTAIVPWATTDASQITGPQPRSDQRAGGRGRRAGRRCPTWRWRTSTTTATGHSRRRR